LQSEGGLDDKVEEIIKAARSHGVPVIFALSRRCDFPTAIEVSADAALGMHCNLGTWRGGAGVQAGLELSEERSRRGALQRREGRGLCGV